MIRELDSRRFHWCIASAPSSGARSAQVSSTNNRIFEGVNYACRPVRALLRRCFPPAGWYRDAGVAGAVWHRGRIPLRSDLLRAADDKQRLSQGIGGNGGVVRSKL